MDDIYVPKRAMAIVAHPDDIEFTCAGTMARWSKHGSKIAYVICTSGEVGIAESGMTKEKAAKIREAEQRKAAEIAGAHEVIFLHQPDGLLQPTIELRKLLVREIRCFRPEVVVTGDPTIVWRGEHYINHPDHRAAAMAALDATFPAAGQPNLFQELEEEGFFAHKTRKVYVTAWPEGDYFVDIDETIEIKLAALSAHASQFKNWDPVPHTRERAAESAKGIEAKYAETFRVVTLVSDEDWQNTEGRVLPTQNSH
jgi:LmbE family N-acetylglucosaminyl deacetylase